MPKSNESPYPETLKEKILIPPSVLALLPPEPVHEVQPFISFAMVKPIKPIDPSAKGCLIEALRRWLFFVPHVGGNTLTTAWTGLGSPAAYRPAVEAGLMTPATVSLGNADRWWRLTESGAKIIQGWLDKGINKKHFEGNDLPFNPDADMVISPRSTTGSKKKP